MGGAGPESDSGAGRAARSGLSEIFGGRKEAASGAIAEERKRRGDRRGDAATDGRRRRGDRTRRARRWGMVWAAGHFAEGRDAEQELEVVVCGAGYQAGEGDQGDDDFAVVGVFGIAGYCTRLRAGMDVGGDTGRGIRGRVLSRGRLFGVLPLCEATVAEGGEEREV